MLFACGNIPVIALTSKRQSDEPRLAPRIRCRRGEADVYLGIDVGTSAVKAVLIDSQDRILAQASAPLNVVCPRPLWSEQDPQDWWVATTSAVTQLPADLRRSVVALGLSGQMHGAVLLDARDRPLRPAILWNDGRSEAECLELERRVPAARQITGNLAMPGFTAPKLLWVHNNEPDVFAAVRTVLLPKDYLRLVLTGEKISDMSDASGTLWLDVGRRCWSTAMLEGTGLSERHMPLVVEGTAAAGRVMPDMARLLGIPEVPVAGGGGDNAASAIGSGAIRPGQALLSLGTSGVIFAVTDRFLPNPARAAHAFCHAIPQRWHQMSVMLSASSALDWAAATAGFDSVLTATAAAQQRGLRPTTPVFLPYLSGERTPHNDPRARGAYIGLGTDTTPADLVVAALEGVAHGFGQGLEALLEAGSTIDELNVVGGGSRLDWWLEILASALDRPLVRRRSGEVGAAFGAARLGRLAVGGDTPEAVCELPPITHTFSSDAQLGDLLRQRRPIFDHAYQRLRPLFREFPA